VSLKPLTLINGLLQDHCSVQDRGLQYGDGLFETISCLRGEPRWFGRHLARLALGCARLGLPMPDEALLRSEVRTVLGAAPRAMVKVILTRGVGTMRGYRPTGDETPTRIVSAHEWTVRDVPEFRVGLSSVPLGLNASLAGLKHLNRLEQVMAQREAARQGWDEALMCSTAGELVSGSMSNLFVCLEGEWLTAPLTHCGVAGVVREMILERAPRLGLKVRIASLSAQDLAGAKALFLTNVRMGLQPVHWYQGRALLIDECGARLQELIDGTLG
jgi:4-amino-4-deoxychorismate lyase